MDNVAMMIREGNIEQAEQELNQRQPVSAADPNWHYMHGRLLEAKGLTDEAMATYHKTLEMDSQHSKATFRLAFCLDLYGDEDEAVRLYKSLADRTPTHVNALLNLATLYEDRGRYEAALNCVTRVLADYPNHARARLFALDIESSMDMFYDESQERTREKRDAILDTPVSDFELSVRSRNCLRKMNIHTLGDLLRISEAELLAYKNFGETSLNEIKAMLVPKGLHLGQLQEEAKAATRPSPARRPLPEGSLELLSRPLSEIEFSSRSRKCLQRLNLITVGDLVIKTEAELLAAKNFGQTSLNEIKAKLSEYGLNLRKID